MSESTSRVIRTPDQRLRVFVSSTLQEVAAERAAAREAITQLRLALHQPHSHWHHDRFEQLLESARRLTDPAERLKFYQAADRLLIDEAGVIPLAYGYYHILLKSWVKRCPVSPFKTTCWKDVIIEPH